MADTFRESLANNQNRVGTTLTTTTTSTNWSDHKSPTRGRREIGAAIGSDCSTRASQLFRPTPSQSPSSSSSRSPSLESVHQNHRMTARRSLLASSRPTKERIKPTRSRAMLWLALALACLCGQLLVGVASGASELSDQKQSDPRSTQPTLDRQLESPSSSSASGSVKPAQQQPAAAAPAEAPKHEQASRPGSAKPPQKAAPNTATQKKAAAALAAQRDYDKYQLKASSSTSPARVAAVAADLAAANAAAASADSLKQAVADKEKASNKTNNGQGDNKQEASAAANPAAGGQLEPAHKKVGQLPNTRPQPKASAFSILKRFLPSFMTSAAAAAAAVSASAAADKQPSTNQHSRSSSSSSVVGSPNGLLSSLLSASHSTGQSSASSSSSASRSGSVGGVGEPSGLNSPLTGKIINLLTGAQKKKGLPEGLTQAIPNHAPFFMRKAAADRQAAGGGGALALASGLLSSPLKLGLLFSAPLLPSLLLTPLALAGLSPAMSAINNFFGDDDEPSSSSQSPLAALTSGSSSPLASILQATGNSPFSSSDSSSSSSSSSSSGPSSSGSSNSFALQALQSLVLGPTSTTERPLFKPGVFASSGIQNAAGAIGSALQSAASAPSSSSSSSNSNNQRPFFGSSGGLMQAAASMISPSFAAPPQSSGSSSSASANNDEDGPGFIQMASDVFEKVANYMGNDNTKDGQAIAQASGPSSPINSPISTLASLSSLSPFQLSSLFASTPLASAMATGSGSSATGSSSSTVGNKNQRVGFFSTLRNVYELFSSSFLRRQEIGNENECQQRLVCEFHQRAMNSKRFKRTLQASIGELVNLDRNLIEQLKYNSQAIQARVDPDTKVMLNDFLKAANNYKSGRDMINCSQMFPKCTRTQLLATANANLKDANNGQAIGKFSQLMKKMKFISNQQSVSQWKLRKPGKSQQQQLGQATRTTSQPIDHAQVVPLQSSPMNVAGQLTPVDSLKLAQQIMMMSQLSQQQQQPQPTNPPSLGQYPSSVVAPQMSQQWVSQSTGGQSISSAPVYLQSQSPQIVANSQMAQAQQQQPNYNSYNQQQQQYSPAPKQQTTYTDAMLPSAAVYNPTESPYFVPQLNGNVNSQQQQFVGIGNMYGEPNQSQTGHAMMSANQPQASNNNSQQQQSQQLQQNSFSAPVQDQSMPQQQQPGLGLNMDNKNKPQQLLSSNKMAAVAA